MTCLLDALFWWTLLDLLKFSARALFSKIICLIVGYFRLTLGGIPCIFSHLGMQCSESLEAKFAHIIVRYGVPCCQVSPYSCAFPAVR
jgi:uncharacterized membrane protein YczE